LLLLATTALAQRATEAKRDPFSPSDPSVAGPYTRQLAAECDLLMRAAVQRRYGWGWDTVPPSPGASPATPRHVTMESLASPAAGLLLLYAADLLEDPRFRDGAIAAARGIASAQLANGNLPAHPTFNAGNAGGREPLALVPDRAATVGAIALLSELLQHENARSEQLKGALTRATNWLLRQQADDGGWLAQIPSPADARESLRVIRLDIPAVRDASYAILLLDQAESTRRIAIAIERSSKKMLALRLAQQIAAPTRIDLGANVGPPEGELPQFPQQLALIWSNAYHPSGLIDSKLDSLHPGADIPATRFAMQTLLGLYLSSGQPELGAALDATRQALLEIRRHDGSWPKRYVLHPATAPSSQPAESVFKSRDIELDFLTADRLNLDPLLQAISQLKQMGRERYLQMLTQQLTLRMHLAGAATGLIDDPLTLDLPVTRGEIEPYIRAHDWTTLSGPPPEQLAPRLQRLWKLYLRTRLEKMAERNG
jgi:hypothetical protein